MCVPSKHRFCSLSHALDSHTVSGDRVSPERLKIQGILEAATQFSEWASQFITQAGVAKSLSLAILGAPGDASVMPRRASNAPPFNPSTIKTLSFIVAVISDSAEVWR